MDQRRFRDCLGLFSTGIVIACARRKNFLTDKIDAEKILHNKIFSEKILNNKLISETALGKSLLEKLKEIFAEDFFGMTINSFSAVSLNPPLVSFCIDNKSSNLHLFKKNKTFSLNILSESQQNLANGFATPKNSKKWGIETYFLGQNGNPIFENSLGYLECRKHRIIKAGDHHIVIGEVVDFGKLNDSKPLLYFQGKYQKL
jgi:3-hydroxy-9,10-secoandrosta-1,3,5(10)-triene-9,17-dione monooxygenase reductase component